ncbi:WAS/WASL-interacting protein family member 3 isoform X2 [Cephus cinctus]|uniref:WAS/WASL-interacting protein family member 3 isoform X2 n=1 Tax=Cephus cinctus TaxID=211228 RepID=A0AAJ7CE81_CEPCN|nr:WAS/WASL-interacting protein family member 3 isoform X2 [Cephus cinctus]
MSAPLPPPPPTNFGTSAAGAGEQGRGLLLQSIRAGKTLKKTVTVDKSAPAISGRVKGEAASNVSNNTSTSAGLSSSNSMSNGGPPGLAGLFSGGMPKLKPTGLRANMSERDNTDSSGNATSSNTLPSVRRGPPPIPPPATQKPQIFNPVQNTSNTDSGPASIMKVAVPKPPPPPSLAPQKPSPPPKKLNLNTNVSRAQSMRLPRSPPVLVAPTPASLHQSQDCLNEQQRPIGRVLRPPVVRPPSPPTSRAPGTVIATRTAPPPPSRTAVSAPKIPPPPPPLPQRTASAQQRITAPTHPLPPTPSTRTSSMRNGQSTANLTDLDVRFADKFHSAVHFPSPEPFRGFPKTYYSKNGENQGQTTSLLGFTINRQTSAFDI